MVLSTMTLRNRFRDMIISVLIFIDFEAPMGHRQLEVLGNLSGLDVLILIEPESSFLLG